MKNISFLVILLTMGLFSCSEDTMMEINRNPNSPTDVESRLIITDIITSSAFSVTGSDLALYASVYVEYNVGIWNQMYNAEMRTTEPSTATTYNNTWNNIYENLWNLKTIIEKCSPEGNEDGNTAVLGMAQILSAYNLSILTDVMGDVPWTEALQPGDFWTPNLDKQESIYAEINNFITEGIANLEKQSSYASIGAQDPLFGGNAGRWIKFAYGLKARYAMRLSKVRPDYNAVISAANNSFANKSEEAIYRCTNFRNPFQRFFTDRDYFGASQSLHDKLVARDDPRDETFFRPHPVNGELIFAPNGSPTQIQQYYSISAQATSNATAPIYLMSYHELEFLKAEAYARLGDLDNAKVALRNAATTALVNAGIDAADATAYYESDIETKLYNQAETLKEVMFQKYLGLFEIESIETYNDVRRLRAMGEGDLMPLASTLRFPLRYSYGNEDVTTNINVRNAYGDGSYVYTENVWWAGGSR